MEINWLAVLAAAVAGFAIGGLWYSPLMFANAWMKAIGKTPEELGNPGRAMAGAAVVQLVIAFVLAVLVSWTGTATLLGGIGLGIVLWLGFSMTTDLFKVLFEDKNLTLFAIDTGHILVVYAVMGAIIGVWR